MASELLCDPCFLENKTVTAKRYCVDCEENLCKECAEFHTRFKAFRLHHILDTKYLKSKLPTLTKHCENHPDIFLEFFCRQHDITCCSACIADTHQSCDRILPLEVASKDIKTSTLLLDSISSVTYITDILEELWRNRDNSLNHLNTSKAEIIQQIGNAKLRMIKRIDEIEQNLIDEVTSIQMKRCKEITEQKNELSQLHDSCIQNKEDLEFLKDHGSDTQLFLSLRQTVQLTGKTENEVKRLSSLFREIDIEFHKNENIEKTLIGSVSEIRRPCKVEYKPKVLQQAQAKANTINSLAEFEIDGRVKLKSGECYYITDMSITRDNNLLLCNCYIFNPKVYMYKDCKEYIKEITCSSGPYGISVIPRTDKAVATLPGEKSIQFINTSDMTKGDKVNIGMEGYSVNATKDKIFVGGEGMVKILDKRGSYINTIWIGSRDIESLYYDEDNNHILCRSDEGMYCCKVDGTVVYQYKVTGRRGLAVDRQGNVYVSIEDNKEIHRLTSDGKFRDSLHTIDSPGVISFNNNYTKLFVGIYAGVTIFKCK